MRAVAICVLSKFPDIFTGFRESVDVDVLQGCQKIVVWDAFLDVDENEKYSVTRLPFAWQCTYVSSPFKIAANANRGWRMAARGRDIVYAGDDTRIIEPKTIERLQAAAYAIPKTGILAARIAIPNIVHVNHDDPNLLDVESRFTWVGFVPFVFVYICRELINAIGYMDERFTGYSFEDCDYCVRARRAGFLVGYANDVVIQHDIGKHFGKTFQRVTAGDDGQIWNQVELNQKVFAEKWGIENTHKKVWEFINSGGIGGSETNPATF